MLRSARQCQTQAVLVGPLSLQQEPHLVGMVAIVLPSWHTLCLVEWLQHSFDNLCSNTAAGRTAGSTASGDRPHPVPARMQCIAHHVCAQPTKVCKRTKGCHRWMASKLALNNYTLDGQVTAVSMGSCTRTRDHRSSLMLYAYIPNTISEIQAGLHAYHAFCLIMISSVST